MAEHGMPDGRRTKRTKGLSQEAPAGPPRQDPRFHKGLEKPLVAPVEDGPKYNAPAQPPPAKKKPAKKTQAYTPTKGI